MEPVTFNPGDRAYLVDGDHARKCTILSQNANASVLVDIDNDPAFRCVLPSDLTLMKKKEHLHRTQVLVAKPRSLASTFIVVLATDLP